MSIVQILITIILPPLAIIMSKGFGKDFIINAVLTILGWIPGVIHAFYLQSRK